MASEKRLIDANALKETVTTDYYEHFTRCHDTDQIALIDMVCDDIEEAPTVDAVEVVHGRWEVDEFGHYCTACREYGPEIEGDAEIVDLLKYGTPYCPNCGAKMDGGNADD